jgi:hypothetical protein
VAPTGGAEPTSAPAPIMATPPAVQEQRPPSPAVRVFQRNERSVVSVVSLALRRARGAMAHPHSIMPRWRLTWAVWRTTISAQVWILPVKGLVYWLCTLASSTRSSTFPRTAVARSA